LVHELVCGLVGLESLILRWLCAGWSGTCYWIIEFGKTFMAGMGMNEWKDEVFWYPSMATTGLELHTWIQFFLHRWIDFRDSGRQGLLGWSDSLG
jgi:hypothetical protein